MATMIRASCAECGDVELTTHEVRVRVCVEDATGSTYVFRCPRCQMSIVKPAEPHVVDLLVASGVVMDRWSLPAELFEVKTGEAIDHDDLIDFHRLLRDDDWFAAVEASILDSDLK